MIYDVTHFIARARMFLLYRKVTIKYLFLLVKLRKISYHVHYIISIFASYKRFIIIALEWQFLNNYFIFK